MNEWVVPIITAVIIGAGGIIGGAVAWRKAGADEDHIIVESATQVVTMLREEMDAQSRRLDMLEASMLAWEGWGIRVLNLLDRLLDMLAEEQRANVLPDVEEARRTRPRYRSVMEDEV